MNSPFILNKVKDDYTITWPTFHDIRGDYACYNLLKLLFEDMKMSEIQLILTNDQMITIQSIIWYSNQGKRYAEWLMSQYNIIGVVFKEKDKAEYLQDYLEKKYVWRLLKM